MTRQEATKIKKILKKENAVFTSTAGYYDGGKKELRVKVVEFLITGYAYGYVPKNETCEQKKQMPKTTLLKY